MAEEVGKASSARGAARRQLIIDVATRFLARNGARGTTLGQIAAQAGLSQAGVVYHFRTKEELLHAVLDNRDQFEDALLWGKGDDPGLDLFGIVADVVNTWSDQPEVVGLLAVLVAENVGDDGPLRQRLADNYRATVERITRTLRSAQQQGTMRLDVDPHLKATEILAFLSGLELAWLVCPDIPAAAAASAWAAQQVESLRP